MTDTDHQSDDGTTPDIVVAREQVARLAIGAGLRHASVAKNAAARTLGGDGWDAVTPSDALAVFQTKVQQVKDGDMAPAVAYLMAQAISLDAIFTQMAARAASNVGEYPQAVERYMRLALKAQSNSRTTLEAIAKITRGGEQIVRHIHVDNRGGQAVIAETLQTGGANGKLGNQSHAQDPNAHIAALPGKDPLGFGVPIASDEERPMSDAWRQGGGAEGQPERMEARWPLGGDDQDGAGTETARA